MTDPIDLFWTIRLENQPDQWLDATAEDTAYAVLDLLRSWIPRGPIVNANLIETAEDDRFEYHDPAGFVVEFTAVTFERRIFVKRLRYTVVDR